MKVLLIANPISGKGKSLAAAEVASAVLKDAGHVVDIHKTQRAGDATTTVSDIAKSYDLIVAVGGDGTLAEVISGVIGLGKPVGVIPVGTANVVARELKIPRDPRKAARILLASQQRPLDVGRVNHRPFLAMVGIGLDGEIVRSIAAARTGPISMATYVKPTLKATFGYSSPKIQIEVDGVALAGPSFGLVVANTKNYGGLFEICPKADAADGWLDYQERRRAGVWAALRCTTSAAFHRSAAQSLTSYGRGRRFRVTSDVPVPVQVDGDFFGTTPVDITLDGQRISIFAPHS